MQQSLRLDVQLAFNRIGINMGIVARQVINGSWIIIDNRCNLSQATDVHLAELLRHFEARHARSDDVVGRVNVRAVVLVVLEGIDAHVAVVIKRGVVAVALVEVDVADGKFGEVNLTNVHVISANRLNGIGIDAVNMYRIARIEVAVHVVVEITDDVHAFLLAARGVGFAAVEPHFLATVGAVDDGILKFVLRHDAGAFEHRGHTRGVVVGTWASATAVHGFVGERVEVAR